MNVHSASTGFKVKLVRWLATSVMVVSMSVGGLGAPAAVAGDPGATAFVGEKAVTASSTTASALLQPFAAAAAAPDVTTVEYPVPTTGDPRPTAITAGPDGNLWFVEIIQNKVARVTPSGVFTEYPTPTPNSSPNGIAAGPDGNLWFTEWGINKVAKVTPSGGFTEYPLPANGLPAGGITAGPDGNLWLTLQGGSRVAKVTPSGNYTEFATSASSLAITAAPDGNLWFTEYNAVGKITPSGSVTEYPLPVDYGPPVGGITAGPDGNLWFTQYSAVAKVTPSGSITEYPLPTPGGNPLGGITAGPDGNVWFTEYSGRTLAKVTPSGSVTEYPIPGIGPWGIASGSDGNLWFTENLSNKVAKAILTAAQPPLALSTSAAAPTVGGIEILTARVTSAGAPQPGVVVSFTVSGVNPTRGTATTDAAGTATISYTGKNVGADSVQATATVASQTLSSNALSIRWDAAPTLIALIPYPLQVKVGTQFTATLGVFSYPQVPGATLRPSSFSVTIDWGDGLGASVATVTSTQFLKSLFPTRDAFSIRAAHKYLTTAASAITITVLKQGETSAVATTRVSVQPLDPVAFFLSNPPIPHQGENAAGGLNRGSIAVLIPAQPSLLQRKVREYRWDFADGGRPVIDNSRTRPLYNSVLSQLSADPGNGFLKDLGTNLGILPAGANGGPFGLGGLSADDVREIVGVWQQQFPNHIVPHVYPDFGTASVALTITDSSGNSPHPYSLDVVISRDCLQWGGNGVLGWNPFAGYTNCDTLAGFNAQFGPHRLPPDYEFIDFGGGVGKVGLAGSGRLQLYITHGILSSPVDSVLLGVQMMGGVGVSTSQASLGYGLGWTGPPDDRHRPLKDSAIANFISNFTYAAGGSVGFGGLSFGTNLILNPSSPPQGGEELFFASSVGGQTLFSAMAGGSCSARISGISAQAAALLKTLYTTWSTSTSTPITNPVIPDGTGNNWTVDEIIHLAVGTQVDIDRAVGNALANCNLPF